MSDKPIEKMTFEELKNEVRLLSDSLAKMKRFYEDAFYNLDNGNFSKTIIKEKNKMKTQIKMNEKEISTLATSLSSYSTISQTAEQIQSTVIKYADTPNATAVLSQTEMTDRTTIYKMLNNDGEYVYYYYNAVTNSWTAFTDSISSVFTQTASGFNMKGNVVIDGTAVITRNLRLSGNVTWDMSNSPVQTQYSSDGTTWHTIFVSGTDKYMHMSFDGGNTWSNSVKVVGTDGQDGQDGSDASVTPQNVFNALTDNGAQQGIFAAFVNNNNRIYINSEYLSARIATVADTLFIGNTTQNGTRRIILTGSNNSPDAYITTVADGYGGYGALKISSILNVLEGQTRISGSLDLSNCTGVTWGNIGVPAVFG